MLKAIIFDFDGVIVNSEPIHCKAFQIIGQKAGYQLNEQQYFDQLVGYDDRDAISAMLAKVQTQNPNAGPKSYQGDRQIIDQLIHQKAGHFQNIVDQGIEPVPGVLDFINHLKTCAMPFAICSGASRQDIDLMLKALGCQSDFSVIVSTDDVAQSKPHPQCYALAVQQLANRYPQLSLKPGQCLAIEDTAAGLTSAKGAGLQTLGITTTVSRDQLTQAQQVIDTFEGLSLEQLHSWFDAS